MNGDFNPNDYASEADYMAGRKRAERRIHREEIPPNEKKRANERGKAGADDSERDNERGSLRPMSVEQMLMRPIPSWLVRGVLPERSFGVIFGAPGSGKSFIMLDMAAAVARGVPWLGRRVHRSGVIYVAGEGHLTLRLRAYLEHYAIATTELARLRVVPANINLMHPETDLEALVSEIRKAAIGMGGVALVVLDTLNAMMPGGDENTSADMGQMVASARRVMDAIGCSVVYVHHSGKDETKGSRGHSSLLAACDFELKVSVIGTERVAETVKQRDGESGDRFAFRLHPIDLGPDPDPEADAGDRLSSCAVVRSDQTTTTTKPIRRDVALDALRETIFEYGTPMPETSTIPKGVKAVTLEQWKARWTLRTGYDDGAGESVRVNFDKDRRALLTVGAIQIAKPYVWIP